MKNNVIVVNITEQVMITVIIVDMVVNWIVKVMKGGMGFMTEKRFVSEDDCYGYYTEIIDNEKELDLSLPNPKKNLTIDELVDLMNELADENEQLKNICKNLINEINKRGITVTISDEYKELLE